MNIEEKQKRKLHEIAISLRDDLSELEEKDNSFKDYEKIPYLVLTMSKYSIYAIHNNLEDLNPLILDAIRKDKKVLNFIKDLASKL